MCTETAGRVVELRETAGLVMAEVAFQSGRRQSCLSYVPELEIGAHVLVAGGAVVERVTEDEAEERAAFASLLLDAFDALQPSTEKGPMT